MLGSTREGKGVRVLYKKAENVTFVFARYYEPKDIKHIP